MIRKNAFFRWNKDERESFEMIKKSIINAPALTSPSFLKTFVLYNFSFDTSYVTILRQLSDENIEVLISFFSSNLQCDELNYSAVEKQAFSVFKTLKHFRSFLLKTHKKIIVPYPVVRQLFIQREVGEK